MHRLYKEMTIKILFFLVCSYFTNFSIVAMKTSENEQFKNKVFNKTNSSVTSKKFSEDDTSDVEVPEEIVSRFERKRKIFASGIGCVQSADRFFIRRLLPEQFNGYVFYPNGVYLNFIKKDYMGCIDQNFTRIYDSRIIQKKFKNNENIIAPMLSKYTRIIEVSAFEGCTNLKHIVIPPMINKLPAKVFANCRNLKSVVILDKVKKININPKTCSFLKCDKLKNIIIIRTEENIINFIEMIRKSGMPSDAILSIVRTKEEFENVNRQLMDDIYTEKYIEYAMDMFFGK